jgi:predicted metal-dependent hydrolase
MRRKLSHEEYREEIKKVNMYVKNEMRWLPENEQLKCFNELVDSLKAQYNESCDSSIPILSLSEFIGRIRPSGNIDVTTSIVYYKNKYEKLQFVTVDDIYKAYEELRISPPSDISQNLREIASKKYYHRIVFKSKLANITEEGIKYIENLDQNTDSQSNDIDKLENSAESKAENLFN